MGYVDVATQEELETVLKKQSKDGSVIPSLTGTARFVIGGSSHVVAWGSSHVEAWESSHVEASQFVAIHRHSLNASIAGNGVLIDVLRPTTVTEWCAFYGVPVNGGHVVLFKAVRDDYRSGHGFSYDPGRAAEAPDWDGGEAECGGGLHFVPHPSMGLEFDREATRFIACPVALADLRPPRADDSYPHKLKARRCGVVTECDRTGKPL